MPGSCDLDDDCQSNLNPAKPGQVETVHLLAHPTNHPEIILRRTVSCSGFIHQNKPQNGDAVVIECVAMDSGWLQVQQFDIKSFIMHPQSLPSFGRQESVCKVKSGCHYGDQDDTKIEMDVYVHGYCDYLLTDTIQHLLYAEAQPVKTGNKGWRKPPANWGRKFWRAFTINSPS